MSQQEQRILYTVPEAAKMLHLPESTVYQHVRKGTIPATKIGRFWRVSALDIARHINADAAELSALLDGNPTQARARSTTVPELPPAKAHAPRFTVRTTSAIGNATERANLTAEQAAAFAAWLMVDPEAMSYTVTRESEN